MSILTSLIPLPYRIGALAVILVGALITARVYWDKSVNAKVAKEIAAYVAQKTKDDQDLKAIDTKTNTKIQIQYVDRVKTITKQGKDNVQIIYKYVHDSELLSNAWVRDHDTSAAGGSISGPTSTDDQASTFTATDALATVASNYATCNIYREQVSAWQDWFNQTNANITAQNEKNKKKK
jgi:hypothetical protein